MDREFLKEMREYAWSYYIANSEARLATFRFYLTFCTILVAGLAAMVGTSEKWPAFFLALLLSFLSYIYWKVDLRHKALIGNAEQALEFLERSLPLPEAGKQPHVLQLFWSEAERSKSYRRFPKHFSPNAHFGYSTCVHLVFGVFGLGGITIAIVLAIS
ncbi:MAG TPA: hypothetical protein VF370_04715 [Candidatus Cryosericum sp.]